MLLLGWVVLDRCRMVALYMMRCCWMLLVLSRGLVLLMRRLSVMRYCVLPQKMWWLSRNPMGGLGGMLTMMVAV